MELERALSYFTGADYLERHFNYQQRLLAENTGSDEPQLPIDGDLKTTGRIYADRLLLMLTCPVVVFSRLAGIDVAITAIKKMRERLAK